eukprot:7227812-Prymnesium_polylepis.1
MEVACRMLESGADGEAVMAMLRAACSSPAALSCCISRIRSAQMAKLSAPASVAREMAPYAHEPGVAAFLSMPLAEMERVKREHHSDP